MNWRLENSIRKNVAFDQATRRFYDSFARWSIDSFNCKNTLRKTANEELSSNRRQIGQRSTKSRRDDGVSPYMPRIEHGKFHNPGYRMLNQPGVPRAIAGCTLRATAIGRDRAMPHSHSGSKTSQPLRQRGNTRKSHPCCESAAVPLNDTQLPRHVLRNQLLD